MKVFTSFIILLFSFSFANFSYAQQPAIVRIGATLPLTGSIAYIGEDIRRGISLALEEENKSPVKFEVIYEDDQALGKNAITAAYKLIHEKKVDVLISLWDMADVVAPVAERDKIPHVSIRWNPHIAEKFKYTFTFESTYKTYVQSQLQLLKAMNVKTVSLATEEASGWILAADELKRRAGEFGIKIVSEVTFQAGTSDFQGIVTRLISKNSQLIIANVQQPPLVTLINKIHGQKPGQRITGYFEYVDPPSKVEQIPFVTQYAVTPAFNLLFQSKYGEKYRARAAHAYDLIKIISFVYSKAGRKITADEFVTSLASIKDFEGATGKLSTNATKNIENIPVWMIVKNGDFVPFTQEMGPEFRFAD